MIKYRTWYDDKIVPIEVEKETKEFVIIDGRRSQKHPERSKDTHYHDTWQQARDHLKADAYDKIRAANKTIDTEEDRLRKLIAMQEPATCKKMEE